MANFGRCEPIFFSAQTGEPVISSRLPAAWKRRTVPKSRIEMTPSFVPHEDVTSFAKSPSRPLAKSPPPFTPDPPPTPTNYAPSAPRQL